MASSLGVLIKQFDETNSINSTVFDIYAFESREEQNNDDHNDTKNRLDGIPNDYAMCIILEGCNTQLINVGLLCPFLLRKLETLTCDILSQNSSNL